MADQLLDAQLDELEVLLEALPESLPEPTVSQSLYSGLLNFGLDPEWEQDIGVFGAVNRGLEVIGGSRAPGLSIKERGRTVQAVAGELQKAFHKIPVDLKRKRPLVESYTSSAPTSPITPDDSSAASDWGHFAPDSDRESLSNSEGSTQSGKSTSESGSPQVAVPSSKRKAKKKKTKSKRKNTVKTGPAFDAIATEDDHKFVDVEPVPPSSTSHLGAPPDMLARKLTKGCHPVGETPSNANHYFCCIASSICHWQNKNIR
ncbi:hypothetical protein BDV93DRAFT_562969 [Ceratobasidium sp. AG-I]|nr:hypothetical protein BDV93DRAFT_562969 [Ceratobasidium sp. AG-I]